MHSQVFESIQHTVRPGAELVPMNFTFSKACFLSCQDPTITKWLPLPVPYTLDGAITWCGELSEQFRAAGQGIHFAIVENEAFCGCISLKNTRWREGAVEIGYWLAPEARGRGLVAESVKLLSRYCIGLGFSRVELRIATENLASRNVADLSRYKFEGILRSAGFVHGGRVDLAMYSWIASDQSADA